MNRRSFVALGLGLGLLPRATWAHPVHSSSAVADIRGRRLEVTLSVTPEDLQEALRRRTKRRLDIDRDPKVEALSKAYARERFVLRGPEGAVPMTWVGIEVEAEVARLYFEFALPKSLQGVRLHDAVFFEIAPAQINRVLVRRGDTSRTLRFRATDPARDLL